MRPAPKLLADRSARAGGGDAAFPDCDDLFRLAAAADAEQRLAHRKQMKAAAHARWAKTPEGKASKAAAAKRIREKVKVKLLALGVTPPPKDRGTPNGVAVDINRWTEMKDKIEEPR